MSETSQKERRLSGAAARIYDDQDDWLQRMRKDRHADPATVARGAIDFYQPIFEAGAQDVPPGLVITLASAIKMSDEATVAEELEKMVLRIGSGALATFPSPKARKLSGKPRRVAGTR